MTKRSDSGAALSQRILERLKNSEFWTAKTRTTGRTIQNLVCPVCGDKNAWAYTAEPWAINCNRANQCGARTKTLELFPELRRDVERDYPATKADPHGPAREYLLSRGITPEALKGVDYRYQANARQTGSGAVMFFVGKDDKGKEILNGRLFNPPSGEGKTHNSGSTAGRYWRHLGHTYDPAQPVYITEGILDALSLHTLGVQAVAVLAAGQDPGKVDLAEFQNLVLAFDNDDAGRRAVKKWKQAHPLADVILCDPGQDWNDLLTSGTLEQAKKQFQTALPRYRANGKLALAETAREWAEIFTDFHGYPPGLFEFNSQTFFAVLKSPKSGEPYLDVARCLRAALKVASFTLDRSNPARPEYRYNLEVQAKGRQPLTITASGKELGNARALNEFLLTTAKLSWEGDAKAATALQVWITGDKRAPEVQLLPVIGYQPEVNAYVFHRWAVDQSGQVVTPDKRGHFRLGYNRIFQAPIHAEEKSITPATITRPQVAEIYQLFRAAWGENGAVALAWTVASWFVCQIKAEINLFPHLSLYGEAGSGKSQLVTHLNAVQGREGEGLPVTTLSTKKGNIRTIGQVSGMFTALIEDKKRNEASFDYSTFLLTSYNRGPLQVQATFSNDLQTKESPFLGTLLFSQNKEPFNDKPEKQRVISLFIDHEAQTTASRNAWEQISATNRPDLAGIMRQVLARRQHFEQSWRQAYATATADLGPLGERRILDNHALILAFHRLFCGCFGIKEDPATVKYFADLARQKCLSSAIRQTTQADYLFEQIDLLSPEQVKDCYHHDQERGLIFMNLPRVERILRNKGLNFQAGEPLNLALQNHPSFSRNGLTYRFPLDPETDESGRTKKRKVWAFHLEWHQNNEMDVEDLPE